MGATRRPGCRLCTGRLVLFSDGGCRGEMGHPDSGVAIAYNRLVDGFRSGQLNLKLEVPSGLARLADPFDPDANLPYRSAPYELYDVSYYHGKLYLYFGITPALVLFWPWVALTGEYLPYKYAVAFFCSVGFLASVDLLRRLWRRYFPETGWGVVGGRRARARSDGGHAGAAAASGYLGCAHQLRICPGHAGAGGGLARGA